jgi:hypothetical protein
MASNCRFTMSVGLLRRSRRGVHDADEVFVLSTAGSQRFFSPPDHYPRRRAREQITGRDSLWNSLGEAQRSASASPKLVAEASLASDAARLDEVCVTNRDSGDSQSGFRGRFLSTDAVGVRRLLTASRLALGPPGREPLLEPLWVLLHTSHASLDRRF